MNQSTASHLSDVLPHVLDHHFISSDGLHSKQTPVVDVRLAESDLFLTELEREKVSLLSIGKADIHVTIRDAKNCSCLCLLWLPVLCSCLLFSKKKKKYKTAH